MEICYILLLWLRMWRLKSQINRGKQCSFYGNKIIVSILYNTCEHSKGHAKPKWGGLFPLFALCVMSDVLHYTQTPLWFFLRTAGSCTQVIDNLKLLLSHSNPYLPLKKFTNHPLKLKPCIPFTIPDIIQQETNLYCVLVHVLGVFV